MQQGQTVHIVSYCCETCRERHSCEAGGHSNGMCWRCGSPMKIDDLFADRRVVTLPVAIDRRDVAIHRAA